MEHRLWSTERVNEGVVVVRVAALVLVDFPLDLFGRVLVIVLLISGHRLQGTMKNKTVLSKANTEMFLCLGPLTQTGTDTELVLQRYCQHGKTTSLPARVAVYH